MSGWDEFYAEIEAEAKAEGPAAVRDLRAKELKYSLITSLIAGRRDLHLTQAQLAARAGVAQEEISRIERGRKSPTIDTYARIAAALGLQPQSAPDGRSRQAWALQLAKLSFDRPQTYPAALRTGRRCQREARAAKSRIA
jgi:transcriptional regulator with XRE-family HTH domain